MSDEVPDIVCGSNPFSQHVVYSRFVFNSSFEDNVVKVARLPRDAVITDIDVYVRTALTGAKLKLGYDEQVNDLGEVDVSAVGKKSVALSGKKLRVPQTHELIVHAKLDKKVNDGEALVVIEYIVGY